MASSHEKSLIAQLRSRNTSEVYDALLKIRKRYTRDFIKMKKFLKLSIIELILPYMEHPKCCNLSLSIIADVCLDLSFVDEVIKHNGPKSLLRIMKSLVNDEVRNRACRALGNIGKFHSGLSAINLLDPIPPIVHFLSETNDANCQITAVRTLTILGNDLKTKELIFKENGVVCIAKLLKSANTSLIICSIKAIASLTKKCNLFCARQLMDPECLKQIVELFSKSEKSIQNNVLLSLTNLSRFEEIRGALVKVGALKLFVDVLSNPETHEKGRLAVFALCNCLDHIHMWSHNGTDQAVGLKSLLIILQNQNFKDIHRHVISSLIPLSYELKISDILLSLNLIQILMNVLSSFVDTYKCKYVTKICKTKIINTKSGTSLTEEINENASEILERDKEINFKNIIDYVLPHALSNKSFNDAKNQSPRADIYEYKNLYSPSDICSPIRKLCSSPGFSDADQSSPFHSSSRSWSPVSDTGESFCMDKIFWSPVVSPGPSSPSGDSDYIYVYEKETSSMLKKSSSSTDKNGNVSEVCSSLSELDKSLPYKFIKDDNYGKFGSQIEEKNSADSRKRMRVETDEGECSKFSSDTDLKNKIKERKLETSESNTKDSDHDFRLQVKNKRNSELSVSESEKKTIDYYIVLLIFQLSFHMEKKPNSQLADKACFSVLMDYICFIHDPAPKAQSILMNLVKNRYCFEKLILSGFILEIEERISSYECSVHDLTNLKEFYLNLLTDGRQEAESDFGVGTLAHILVSAEKSSQFLVLCAISKLVTRKTALKQLLVQANGLALLFRYFGDDCVLTRKKAVICLCELYQSLIKDYRQGRCCFSGTCNIKMSEMCSYQKAFLNVTFLVDSGEKLLANREKLCENSEYFKALLEGSFMETDSQSVSLPLISADTLSIIFHFLHGCGFVKCCPYIKHLTLPVLLELLSNCDRFLLMDFKTLVEDRLCHNLYPDTISKIYAKSKVHNSPELSKRALKYALSMNILEKEVLWSCFDELIPLDANFNIFCDIECLLKSLI